MIVLAASVGARSGRRAARLLVPFAGGGAGTGSGAPGRRPRAAGSLGIRFMSASSPPTAPKISPPVTLRKPTNPVPGRRPSRGLRRAALLLPQARKPTLCGPRPQTGCLADAAILWLVQRVTRVTAVCLGLPSRFRAPRRRAYSCSRGTSSAARGCGGNARVNVDPSWPVRTSAVASLACAMRATMASPSPAPGIPRAAGAR
jgi:hypothetical protein